MKVYQASDGRWLIYNNGVKSQYFSLESEAQEMATKLNFAEQAQTEATIMGQLSDKLASLYSVYFDRGYDSGPGAITDVDIASLGITAAQLGLMMTLAEQIANFLGNVAVTPGDYDSTLNVMRTDI